MGFDIYEKGKEKLKKMEPLKRAKNHYKELILSALLFWGGTEVVSRASHKPENKQAEKIIKEKNYPFPKDTLAYWDLNQDFFKKDFKIETEKLEEGITIKRDAGLVFYVATKDDIKIEKKLKDKEITVGKGRHKKKKTIKIEVENKVFDFEGIRKKLAKYPEFSYLLRDEYSRDKSDKTHGFNVLQKDILENLEDNETFLLPIPLDSKVRGISPENFVNYAYDAVEEMKNDSIYGKKIRELIRNGGEADLIASLVAFARSETAEEYTALLKPIGGVELQRWEEYYKTFSFSYFHILMENNADGSPGPGKRARFNLGLTEGQCYHPKNGCKLCLAYWIEKTEGNLKNYFPFNEANIQTISKSYNGPNYKKNKYDEKLTRNYLFIKKLLSGEIKRFDNKNLQKQGFKYKGFDKKFNHKYEYIITEGNKTVGELKADIIKKFNLSKDEICPNIKPENIARNDTSAISDKIVLSKGDTLYIYVK